MPSEGRLLASRDLAAKVCDGAGNPIDLAKLRAVLSKPGHEGGDALLQIIKLAPFKLSEDQGNGNAEKSRDDSPATSDDESDSESDTDSDGSSSSDSSSDSDSDSSCASSECSSSTVETNERQKQLTMVAKGDLLARLDPVRQVMRQNGYYESSDKGPYRIYFRDLLESRILVEKGDARWKISGITCHDALAIRESFASSPLSFIWGQLPEQAYLDERMADSYEDDSYLMLSLEPDQLLLKQIYDSRFSSAHSSATYGKGMWARMLFLCTVLNDSPSFVKRLLRGWEIYVAA